MKIITTKEISKNYDYVLWLLENYASYLDFLNSAWIIQRIPELKGQRRNYIYTYVYIKQMKHIIHIKFHIILKVLGKLIF